MKKTIQREIGMRRRSGSAFSILELMVSMAVLSMLLVMVFEMLASTQTSWRKISATAGQFREARLGFETISRRLRQATLNTYWDYVFTNSEPKRPLKYIRQSELHFVSGATDQIVSGASDTKFPTHSVFFQAPFGFSEDDRLQDFTELLNAWGYFVEYGDDTSSVPPFLREKVAPRYRFRLKEMRQPSEELGIFNFDESSSGVEQWRSTNSIRDKLWYSQEVTGSSSTQKRVVAENIVALILTPLRTASAEEGGRRSQIPINNNYIYDSREGIAIGRDSQNVDQPVNLHMLPSLVRVTMVAVDEVTFNRLNPGSSPPTMVKSGLFKNALRYDEDVKELREDFDEKGYSYNVFTTVIPMKAARWTSSRELED